MFDKPRINLFLAGVLIGLLMASTVRAGTPVQMPYQSVIHPPGSPQERIEISGVGLMDDEQLGARCHTNNIMVEKRFRNDQLIFSATYTTDEYARRVNAVTRQGSPHQYLMLFGGSIVFGDGVNDQQTVSHFLNEQTGYAVYNYGRSGAGLNFVLAKMADLRWRSEIPFENGKLILIITNEDIKRLLGTIDVMTWAGREIRYTLDSNQRVERLGSFEKNGTLLQRMIINICHQGWSLCSLFSRFQPQFSRHDIDFAEAAVRRAEGLYHEQFASQPFSVVYLGPPFDREFYERIKAAGIPIEGFETKAEWRLNNDGHLNELGNRALADFIRTQVLKCDAADSQTCQ